MKNEDITPVTRPYLPKLDEYINYLKEIWDSRILTNMGQFHNRLEKELVNYLKVKNLSLVSNGTLALMLALEALNIKGEVITTPFTFIATINALIWKNIKPIFVDIEPKYFTIDPNKIENAISSNTSAILGVHVYGNPCYIEEINKLANKYKLKVIYDAAHAFGVTFNNKSVLTYGDISILSFHATKIFSTAEGGAVITNNNSIDKKIKLLRNFGFQNEESINSFGINAKMDEFKAALGLIQLKYINNIIYKRKQISLLYKNELKNIDGIQFLINKKNISYNYSYFPIFINKKKYGIDRDKLYNELRKNNILVRKYFYPLIYNFKPYKKYFSYINKNDFPIAESISKQVLCLPLYHDLKKNELERIINIIKKNYKN